jgi:hypothetical protein
MTRVGSLSVALLATVFTILCGAPAVADAANSVSVVLNPVKPFANQPTTLTFSGSSDVPAALYATYFDAVSYMASGGQICNGDDDPSYRYRAGDRGTEIVSGQPVDGPFSLTITRSIPDQYFGVFHLCMWLADPNSVPPGATLGRRVDEGVEFDVPPLVVLATRVHSTFPKTATGLHFSVSTQITAQGTTPQGYCVLEARSAGSWLYATPFRPVGARGRCPISIRVARPGRRQYRVSFRAAEGFKGSVGVPAWVGVER